MTKAPSSSPSEFLPVEGEVLYPLPSAYRLAIPRLGELRLKREPRADCRHCVMMAPDGQTHVSVPWSYHPETRCCTYHPEIPNFFAGQALLRGNESAAAIRQRLADPGGVTELGIVPSDAYEERDRASGLGFGKDPSLRCPFFRSAELSCSIWPERGMRCRTYFCKHELGLIAIEKLQLTTHLLERATLILAKLCAEGRTAPKAGDPVEDWASWYVDCAHRLETLTDVDVINVSFRWTNQTCDRIVELASLAPQPMPDVVVPHVKRHLKSAAGDIYLIGHAFSDGVIARPEALTLFTLLDGKRSLQDASSLMAGMGLPMLDPAVVGELYRTGVLQPVSELRILNLEDADDAARTKLEDLPETLALAAHEPIVLGDLVWLQGATTFLSLIAPKKVFHFLGRLDGTKPWREAFAEANAEESSSIDLELLLRLCQVGVLVAPVLEE